MSIAFHLAIPVDDLVRADQFYGGVLACPMGRRSEDWTDYNFFGHQLVVHLVSNSDAVDATSAVDGDNVPVRHFGLVLDWPAWEDMQARLEAAGWSYLIAPKIRFAGQPGEQGTFFVTDPAGNALEFKTFRDPDKLFDAGI